AKKDKASSTADAKKPNGVNVIYVADIDVLSSTFVRMRNEPNTMIANFRFDNVPFVCNLIDAVADENRFLAIRKRKPKHSTLRMVESRAADDRSEGDTQKAEKQKEYDESVKKADEEKDKYFAEVQKVVQDLERRQNQGEEIDAAELRARMSQRAMRQR